MPVQTKVKNDEGGEDAPHTYTSFPPLPPHTYTSFPPFTTVDEKAVDDEKRPATPVPPKGKHDKQGKPESSGGSKEKDNRQQKQGKRDDHDDEGQEEQRQLADDLAYLSFLTGGSLP